MEFMDICLSRGSPPTWVIVFMINNRKMYMGFDDDLFRSTDMDIGFYQRSNGNSVHIGFERNLRICRKDDCISARLISFRSLFADDNNVILVQPYSHEIL